MKHQKGNMVKSITNSQLKRKSLDAYKNLSKKELMKSFVGFIVNFDKLRYNYVQIQLENNFLQRKVDLLEDHIRFIEDSEGRTRSKWKKRKVSVE